MSIDVMASLKDIAETAGCSVSTVSRVLKNKGEIAPATRKKILAIADRFGYHDNRLIYGIRTGRTQTIGLVCDFGNPFFQRLAHGIELELKKKDYLVIFSSNAENDQQTLKRLVEQRVDGVILVPRNDFADTEYFRDVISRGLPIITIDRKTPANVDYVGSDDLYCGRIMAEHFYSFGHRKIAYYAGPSYASPAQLRLQGFSEFCREHSDISLSILHSGKNGNGCAPEEKKLLDFLKKHKEITAFGTFYDYFAYDVCRAAWKLGRKIPEDLAVAGVGDMIPPRARLFELTTIDQMPEKIAEAAVKRMMKRLSLPKNETLPIAEIRIKPNLIVRNSTLKERCRKE